MSNDNSHISILINRMITESDLTRFSITYDDDSTNHQNHQLEQLLPHKRTAQLFSLPDEYQRQAIQKLVSQEIAQLELPRKIRRYRKESPDQAEQNV